MTSIFQIGSLFRLGRGLRATALAAVCALGGPALVQAQGTTATLDNAASTERLIAEFGGWIGNHHDADQLITTLRSGRPTATEGAASVKPATGPMGYGEVRLVLKLAQGALAQQGVPYPNSAQLQAALHGGPLFTPQGEQVLEGVLPQKAQGVGWASMAGRYGLTHEDMLPPPGKAVTVKGAEPKPAKAPSAAAAKGKTKAGAKAKASAKGKAKAKPVAKNAASKSAKPAAKQAKKTPARK